MKRIKGDPARMLAKMRGQEITCGNCRHLYDTSDLPWCAKYHRPPGFKTKTIWVLDAVHVAQTCKSFELEP